MISHPRLELSHLTIVVIFFRRVFYLTSNQLCPFPSLSLAPPPPPLLLKPSSAGHGKDRRVQPIKVRDDSSGGGAQPCLEGKRFGVLLLLPGHGE